MSHPYHHALSSARKWGGKWEDYMPLHSWFDETKAVMPDQRHRALRHHAEGIFLAEKIFGPVIRNSAGQDIPTRVLGEQHVKEDMGSIPTAQDWLRCMAIEPWMNKPQRLSSQITINPKESCEQTEACAGDHQRD